MMAQYGPMMQQQWSNGPHDLSHQPHGPQIANGSQDPKRPPQQPVIHVVGDVKPRLTKEQHDILEAHFQQQAKPSTNTKKGFAESLGVPLDKINNWFQNRRAKVKQDMKKQMNAYNMYQQQLAMAHMNNQPPPQTHEFFAAHPHLDPSAFHPDAMRAPMDPHNPNFAVQPHPQLIGMLGSIPESHHHATSDDIMHNLAASGYQMENIDISSIAAKPNFMAFEGPQDFMFDPNYQMSTNVQDFGAQFSEMPGQGDGFDFQNFVPGAPMQATQSNGSTPSIPSTLSSVQSNSTMPSSVGTMSVPTLSSAEWSDENKPTISFSNDQQMQNAYSSPPEDPTSLWAQTQQQTAFEQAASPEEMSRPASSQNLPPTPPSQDQKSGDLDPNSALPLEALSRRPSSTNGLTESMGNVDIQQRSASMDAAFKQPAPPSGLAARRQRPRPAALGEAALRSASYSAGMPISPGANTNLNPPDQSLRRIRSSGVPGVQSGRVQKQTSGTGQRSPLNMTFAEAAASPKFAHHASQYATVSSPGSHVSLAPPTPLTPNEGARFPSWQSHHSVNTSVDHGSPNGIAVSWASESPATFPSHHVSSPPQTPLDAEQAAQYQAYLRNAAVYRDTPPQSAPANQQSFSGPFGPAAAQMSDTLTVNTAHLAHIRRPSLPENVNMSVPHMPMVNAPTGDMPLTYQPMPFNHPQFSQPPPQQTLPSQTTAAFPTPPHPAPVPIPVQHPSLLSADFAVHEYTPPSAQGRSKNSASPTEGYKENIAPKVYHFANQGPRDFEGQQP